MTFRTLSIALAVVAAPSIAIAGPEAFGPGPLIEDFGRIASLPDAAPLPAGTHLKVVFDIAERAEVGKANRRIDSAARFLNMHAAAGVAPEDMQVALVIHGGASRDLLLDTAYGAANPSRPLIAALLEAGVRIELCGQTAAFHDIAKDDLIPGVQMSISAMTSHALLQQSGYTLNPF